LAERLKQTQKQNQVLQADQQQQQQQQRRRPPPLNTIIQGILTRTTSHIFSSSSSSSTSTTSTTSTTTTTTTTDSWSSGSGSNGGVNVSLLDTKQFQLQPDSHKKSLRKLNACRDKLTIILDDSPQVWCMEDQESILKVTPFMGESDDTELKDLLSYLKGIHQNFFSPQQDPLSPMAGDPSTVTGNGMMFFSDDLGTTNTTMTTSTTTNMMMMMNGGGGGGVDVDGMDLSLSDVDEDDDGHLHHQQQNGFNNIMDEEDELNRVFF
jgi:hypothetical protein